VSVTEWLTTVLPLPLFLEPARAKRLEGLVGNYTFEVEPGNLAALDSLAVRLAPATGASRE
jgi:hypothetical protein